MKNIFLSLFAWAIINTQSITNADGTVTPAGTVLDLIAYNGTNSFTPSPGSDFKQVPDNTNIGDFIGVQIAK